VTALLIRPATAFESSMKSTSAWENADSFAEPQAFQPRRQPFDDSNGPADPEEPSDLEDPLHPFDDDRWDVFLPDDNDPDGPRPEPGDFWIDADEE